MKLDEPLSLPKGSVRALITIILIVSVVVLAFLDRTNEFLIGLASAAFGYYFGTRGGTGTTESEVMIDPLRGEEEEGSSASVVPGDRLEE